jgi:hypothetical protein
VQENLDLPAFTVIDVGPDLAAPVLDLMSARWVDGATVPWWSTTVRLELRVTDDSSGVHYVVGELTGPDGKVVQLYIVHKVSGTIVDGVWEMSGRLPDDPAKGPWQVTKVYAPAGQREYVLDDVGRHPLGWGNPARG